MSAERPERAKRPGMTLVEVVIAMAVLGIVLVSLLQGSAVSLTIQVNTSQVVSAGALARELLDCVCALPYDDPDGDAGPGLDAGELAADRTTFDDLDDFDAWSESPPSRPDGVAMPGMALWARTIEVENVDPSTLAATLPNDDRGAKRIAVSVWREGKLLATIERYRYSAADEVTR